MKRLLLIILPLLLIIGCSKPISEETLIEEDGLKYHPDTKELYTGGVFMNLGVNYIQKVHIVREKKIKYGMKWLE